MYTFIDILIYTPIYFIYSYINLYILIYTYILV
jgi:hypothetical protein